jgi:hypothetical protein
MQNTQGGGGLLGEKSVCCYGELAKSGRVPLC